MGSFAEKNIDYKAKKINIKTCKLDDFKEKYSIKKIDLLKLNIQGSEGLVVEGAKNIIEKDLPMIIKEFWQYGIKSIGYDPKKFTDYFLSLNYEFIQFTLQIDYKKR